MIKIKNILTAILYQLKSDRPIGNYIFKKSSHYLNDGYPKIKYKNKKSVIETSEFLKEKFNSTFIPYKCIYCDGWHLIRSKNEKKLDNRHKNNRIQNNKGIKQ